MTKYFTLIILSHVLIVLHIVLLISHLIIVLHVLHWWVLQRHWHLSMVWIHLSHRSVLPSITTNALILASHLVVLNLRTGFLNILSSVFFNLQTPVREFTRNFIHHLAGLLLGKANCDKAVAKLVKVPLCISFLESG